MVASILARDGQCRDPQEGGDVILIETSDFFGSKFLNALRNASRLRRMIDQDRPAWNPSSISFSQRARLSYSALPTLHRDRRASADPCPTRRNAPSPRLSARDYASDLVQARDGEVRGEAEIIGRSA